MMEWTVLAEMTEELVLWGRPARLDLEGILVRLGREGILGTMEWTVLMGMTE